MAPPLVIWGAGDHALVVAEIVRLRAEYELIGWLDDVNVDRHGATYAGLPILGGREQLERLRGQGVDHIAVAIGRCDARLRRAELARHSGYRLPALIHPRASVGTGVPIGEGTVLKAGAIVDVSAEIGAAVILSHVSVGHGSILEDGVLLSCGVCLAGRVRAGRGSSLGAGVAVRDRIQIGRGCLIGTGAVVVRDIPDGVVAYGVPARAVRPVAVAEGP